MKKFLSAAVLCLALFSIIGCEKNKGKGKEQETPVPVKRVKTYSLVGDGWADVYQYSYDDQGRVSRVFREERKAWDFSYENNKVIVKNASGNVAFDITLGDNKYCKTMKNEDGDVYTYIYNAEGYMVKSMKGEDVASDITIEDGCITVWTRWKEGTEQFKEHTYTKVKNVGGIHNIHSEASGLDRWMFETGLFGKGTAYLCGGNKWKHSDKASTLSYDYDKDGYVVAEHKDYPGYPEEFQYTWELVK